MSILNKLTLNSLILTASILFVGNGVAATEYVEGASDVPGWVQDNSKKRDELRKPFQSTEEEGVIKASPYLPVAPTKDGDPDPKTCKVPQNLLKFVLDRESIEASKDDGVLSSDDVVSRAEEYATMLENLVSQIPLNERVPKPCTGTHCSNLSNPDGSPIFKPDNTYNIGHLGTTQFKKRQGCPSGGDCFTPEAYDDSSEVYTGKYTPPETDIKDKILYDLLQGLTPGLISYNKNANNDIALQTSINLDSTFPDFTDSYLPEDFEGDKDRQLIAHEKAYVSGVVSHLGGFTKLTPELIVQSCQLGYFFSEADALSVAEKIKTLADTGILPEGANDFEKISELRESLKGGGSDKLGVRSRLAQVISLCPSLQLRIQAGNKKYAGVATSGGDAIQDNLPSEYSRQACVDFLNATIEKRQQDKVNADSGV